PDPMDEYNRSQQEQSFNDRLVYGASLAALIARSTDMGAYQVLEEASTEGRVKPSSVYDSASKGIRNTQGIIGGAIGGIAAGGAGA
ncbi:hypothetical protein M3M33_15335, partial [Loigolactobacillus coryniformis]|uniref:hypothetical protein n=1 Tax=Loigolactobacillus coryniformis TaxID=1610 RepID=UPI00201A6C4E